MMTQRDNKRIQDAKSIKVEIVTLLILVPLASVMGYLVLKWPSLELKDSNPPKVPLTQNATSASSQPDQPIQTPTPTSQLVEPQEKTITLQILGPSINQSWVITAPDKITVAEILSRAVDQHGLNIITRDYGETMGIYVESISGLAGNPKKGTYWHLYINNELSPLGASQAQVKVGDLIIWRYEKEHTNYEVK